MPFSSPSTLTEPFSPPDPDPLQSDVSLSSDKERPITLLPFNPRDFVVLPDPLIFQTSMAAAPTFDQAKPRELSRFFKDLEKLFTRVGVTSKNEKKDHILEYIPFDVEQIWRTFPEYSTQLSTYKDFKDAILVHYPDATGDYIYAPRWIRGI